jgi:molybdopterin synthase sulfur carrier subunit
MVVRFFAYLRKFTGCAEADFPYRETAGALARSICERYGEDIRQKFFPSGYSSASENPEGLGPEITFLVNGRHICHLGGLAAPLNPGDRIDIFPMVAGG